MTDIALDGGGDILLTDGAAALVDGADGVVQPLFIHLRTFQGEWFLNLRAGLPYFERILIRGANEADLFQIYHDAILSRPGIASVDSLSVDFGSSDNRVLSISGEATSNEGQVPISLVVPGVT